MRGCIIFSTHTHTINAMHVHRVCVIHVNHASIVYCMYSNSWYNSYEVFTHTTATITGRHIHTYTRALVI